MGDHLVLNVDRLAIPESLRSIEGDEIPESSTKEACVHTAESSKSTDPDENLEEHSVCAPNDEEEPLIQMVECRICQEEDHIKNLEIPCACSGSLKFAHRKCVQHWCNEKGDITCEICHQPYQPGYTAPPVSPHSEDVAIDIRQVLFLHIGEWTISGAPLDLHDPRLLAMAAAERRLLEAEYDEYADTNASGAAFCRSAAIILMALLLLRHALTITDGDGDGEDDVSAFFSLFLLRAAGFLLPCYIMAWAISILQRRRQRQEAAALAATEVAFMLQAGQRRGLQFTIAPGPSATPHQEPLQ
ncbi:Zinc finger, RING-CH-type [Dillenia turbinata]|uniref:Zinc finger, RING-CH-type n=1 Tax=Dillenia turbinata TaxID=194707 RepID=A0AAN8UZX0_9MAGN